MPRIPSSNHPTTQAACDLSHNAEAGIFNISHVPTKVVPYFISFMLFMVKNSLPVNACTTIQQLQSRSAPPHMVIRGLKNMKRQSFHVTVSQSDIARLRMDPWCSTIMRLRNRTVAIRNAIPAVISAVKTPVGR